MHDTATIEAFWQERVHALQISSIPVTQCILPLHATAFSTTWRVEWTLDRDETVYAVLSLPTAPGPHPALLLIPPYGSAVHVAPYEVRQQFITLTLQHRGMRLTRSTLPAAFPGFLTAGIEAVATYGLTRVVEDCVLGARFLAILPARADRPLLCRGHELALLTAALVPTVTHVVCRMDLGLYRATAVPHTTDYPLAEISDYLRQYPDRVSQVEDTLRYFDPRGMAHRVQAAVLLVSGGPYTPAMAQELFNAMPAAHAERSVYPSCYSTSQDERCVMTWMARASQVGDPVLPSQWTCHTS